MGSCSRLPQVNIANKNIFASLLHMSGAGTRTLRSARIFVIFRRRFNRLSRRGTNIFFKYFKIKFAARETSSTKWSRWMRDTRTILRLNTCFLLNTPSILPCWLVPSSLEVTMQLEASFLPSNLAKTWSFDVKSWFNTNHSQSIVANREVLLRDAQEQTNRLLNEMLPELVWQLEIMFPITTFSTIKSLKSRSQYPDNIQKKVHNYTIYRRSIAAQLKAKEEIIPRSYEYATVLFCQLVDFGLLIEKTSAEYVSLYLFKHSLSTITHEKASKIRTLFRNAHFFLASSGSAEMQGRNLFFYYYFISIFQIISFLNDVFNRFDEIIKAHDAYKVYFIAIPTPIFFAQLQNRRKIFNLLLLWTKKSSKIVRV